MSCCSTTTTASRKPLKAPLAAALALCAAVSLAACSPKGPPGIDTAALDAAIGDSIGDPTTCVIIARKGSGQTVWRYGRNMTCGASWPACDSPASQTTDQLAQAAAKGETKAASCASAVGGVGWAAGPVPTSHPDKYGDLVYAAAMSSKRALPGREMATRLESAFAKAGF